MTKEETQTLLELLEKLKLHNCINHECVCTKCPYGYKQTDSIYCHIRKIKRIILGLSSDMLDNCVSKGMNS